MKHPDKWAVIINPIAGNDFANTYVPEIKKKFEEHGIKAEWAFTEGIGHASELAQAFADKGFKTIIGVGGDGTMNEIASPLLGNTELTLGLIPAGTGNDFNQILGFPDRFEEDDWDNFFKEETQMMDVGLCNDMPFLNGMGLGFDAQVAAENYVESGEVKKGGKGKYIWQILKTLLFFKEKTMITVTAEGKKETDCFINTISIGRRFAGGFLLTPKAIANDGLLEVCNINRLNLIQRLRILMMVPKGTHTEDKKVNYYQTDKISLEFPEKVPFHVDGELHFAEEFDIHLKPKSIKIIYNPNGKHFFNV